MSPESAGNSYVWCPMNVCECLGKRAIPGEARTARWARPAQAETRTEEAGPEIVMYGVPRMSGVCALLACRSVGPNVDQSAILYFERIR